MADSLATIAGMKAAAAAARLALDPSEILRAQGIIADQWQRDFLLCEDRRVMLLCCRGAGKSRATSAKALHKAFFSPASLTLLVSRSQRQSMELFRYVKQGYAATGAPIRAIRETMTELELQNGSRVVCLPGKEDTVRGYQGVALLIKDEAAKIPDDLNSTVAPMIAISRGQEIDLSTPFGQRGWFWKKWFQQDVAVKRFKVDWRQCPRHSAEFIEQERSLHGDSWVAQEYECSFESLSGLVFPRFEQLANDDDLVFEPTASDINVGGLDFGYRNPFAAIWGRWHVDSDVIHIDHERYLREYTLNQHAKVLPKEVTWYADPAGAQEIASLRRAGFVVKKGLNDIRPGIMAVQARLETGRLKVSRDRCPHTFAEAQLYRWPETGSKEVPVDEDNHAMAALRYLVATIDRAFISRIIRKPIAGDEMPFQEEPPPLRQRIRDGIDWNDPELWTPLN